MIVYSLFQFSVKGSCHLGRRGSITKLRLLVWWSRNWIGRRAVGQRPDGFHPFRFHSRVGQIEFLARCHRSDTVAPRYYFSARPVKVPLIFIKVFRLKYVQLTWWIAELFWLWNSSSWGHWLFFSFSIFLFFSFSHFTFSLFLFVIFLCLVILFLLPLFHKSLNIHSFIWKLEQ